MSASKRKYKAVLLYISWKYGGQVNRPVLTDLVQNLTAEVEGNMILRVNRILHQIQYESLGRHPGAVTGCLGLGLGLGNVLLARGGYKKQE